jgi:hypothetical protein
MGRTRGLPWDVDTAFGEQIRSMREEKKKSDTLKLAVSYLIDLFSPCAYGTVLMQSSEINMPYSTISIIGKLP